MRAAGQACVLVWSVRCCVCGATVLDTPEEAAWVWRTSGVRRWLVCDESAAVPDRRSLVALESRCPSGASSVARPTAGPTIVGPAAGENRGKRGREHPTTTRQGSRRVAASRFRRQGRRGTRPSREPHLSGEPPSRRARAGTDGGDAGDGAGCGPTGRGRTPGCAATTINDAIAGWMENGWPDLSPSTVWRYRSLVKTRIEEAIGKRPIASPSPYDVELFFRTLKAKGLSDRAFARYGRCSIEPADSLASGAATSCRTPPPTPSSRIGRSRRVLAPFVHRRSQR